MTAIVDSVATPTSKTVEQVPPVRFLVLWMGVVAALPMVVFHSWQLWSLPYAKTFPLVYLGILYFLWRQQRVRLEKPGWRNAFVIAALLIGGSFGILANAIFSPWVGQLSFVFLTLSLVICYFAEIPFHRIAKLAFVLLLLTIPTAVATRMETSFLKYSSQITSNFLEELSWAHFADKNTISVPKIDFDWMEHAHGMESLFLTTVVLGLSWLIRNRGLLTSIFEVLTIPFLATWHMTVRVLVVLGAMEWMDVDLTTGTAGVLFYFIFTIWIGLSTWLVLVWIRYVMKEIPPPDNRDSTPLGAEVFNRISRWPWPSTVAKVKTGKSSSTSLAGAKISSSSQPVASNASSVASSPPQSRNLLRKLPSIPWRHLVPITVAAWCLLAFISFLSYGVLWSRSGESTWGKKGKAHLETMIAKPELEGILGKVDRVEVRSTNHPMGGLGAVWILPTEGNTKAEFWMGLGEKQSLTPLAFYSGLGWEVQVELLSEGQEPTLVAKLHDPRNRVHAVLVARSYDREGKNQTNTESDNSKGSIGWQRFSSTPIYRALLAPSNPPKGFVLQLLREFKGEATDEEVRKMVDQLQLLVPAAIQVGKEAVNHE